MTDVSPAARNGSINPKRITGVILLLVLSAVFIFSAYTKIYSENAFDAFEWTFLDLGLSSITFASILAHLFIGFEFMIGLFLLAHIFLKPFTYPITIAILAVFIIYLLVVITQQGNTGSCGCFGDKLQMSPLSAIWKNLLMIIVTIILIRIYPGRHYKNQEWIAAVIGMAALITPFIISPLNANSEPETVSEAINLNPLYTTKPAPAENLKVGKHIIGFMSLTCPHCKKAAYLLQIIHKQHPEIPMYLILNGPPKYDSTFFAQTHAINVPHIIYRNLDGFMQMAGPYVPSIVWVNNNTIVRKSTYYQLDPKYMLDWIKK